MAADYLSHLENPSEKLISEISNNIENCFDDTKISFFVKGKIQLLTGQNDEDFRQAFENIEKAAILGDVSAACLLGELHKSGIGCSVDFEKAFYWFENAADSNNEKAKYSLGYMYLKGLGSIEQSYEEAIEWFENSSYPMAKHWLAICQFYGLGLDEGKESAKSKLDTLSLENSKNFINHINELNANRTVFSFENQLLTSTSNSSNVDKDTLLGDYEGHIFDMDWSGNKVISSDNLQLNLTQSKDGSSIEILMQTRESIFNGSGYFYNNVIYPEGLEVVLPFAYVDRPEYKNISWAINSISFESKKIKGDEYLFAHIDAWSSKLQEPLEPTILVLTKNQLGLSESEIDGIAAQNDFIKVYPNPVETDFLVQYELPYDSNSQLTLYNMMGYPVKSLSNNVYQRQGIQTLRFDGSDIVTGNYVLKLSTGKESYNKVLIKK
ncbi:hypothetical protein MED217_18586 [Leeuwenhoekiella blandensis MED217]|uniref:Secretion system C-terminal sorting domain-containing protein n=1 Tax=Leeuwenhoekiella blandensis (strain CECT 7118 / CCUG 51940 / KCTC 22103 / MED217) TaxID=398720 RepID=A3XRD7_LEEBM|nr:hypothetical protein MED217_18586 [Leeuwenhoekiella blandensis MED217]